MNKKLQEFSAGGLAWLVSGLGPRIVLAPEDGAGAGGGDGGQGGGEGGNGGAGAGAGGEGSGGAAEGGEGGEGGADGGKPALYRPDGLPDHLLGETDQQTIDRLNDAYKGMRKQMGSVPDKPDGYKFDMPDALKAHIPEGDPALLKGYEVAHNLKIPKEQFQALVEGVFLPIVEKGGFAPAYDAAKEVEAIRQSLNLGIDEAGKNELTRHVTETNAYLDGLAAQVKLNENETAELKSLMDTADGYSVLGKLKGLLTEKGIQVDGGAAGGGDEKAWLASMDSDPRVDPNSTKFEPQLRKKYDEAYQRVYG